MYVIYVVAPDYLKCYVIILHNTCYDNLILMGISFFLATRPYVYRGIHSFYKITYHFQE